ncbi:probable pterin-4-alpha-carbinolamine dehydratase, chloroplastic [Magnolia sinica]|uniref:probable pterin-4-alpha-carbinolamine dehydratase, chloroplastic n=1 Tax=Magnolia sinica TaxID=86752 RepID=UPI002657B244|nr:probable pterin-4-alpha-carbinolamine dehydratase, chloroplastic [Magnolia sinica]
MASSSLCFSPSLLPILFPSSLPSQKPLSCATLSFTPTLPTPSNLSSFSNHPSLRRKKQQSHALGGDLLGDFGARDPFPAEIESGFAENVLGNVDTEHRILIPNILALSLSQQKCTPISASQTPMTEDEAKSLLRKVVGWRLVESEGRLRIQCLWRLRDFACGVELINRIYKVIEDVGHYPNLHLEQPNQVRAELWTASIGGLSMNDFIVAAKIDEIKTSDLVPKKRVWA